MEKVECGSSLLTLCIRLCSVRISSAPTTTAAVVVFGALIGGLTTCLVLLRVRHNGIADKQNVALRASDDLWCDVYGDSPKARRNHFKARYGLLSCWAIDYKIGEN